MNRFGRQRQSIMVLASPPAVERFRFGPETKEWETDADLQYNRVRCFDPSVGRWISEEPLGIEAGDENVYPYPST